MRSIHKKTTLAVVGAAILALPACQYIPGTNAYKIERAKEIAARDLIDPSSGQFRDLYVKGDMVCGEINGKNRMGAYVGFKRFFARIGSETSMIDPEFELSDKLAADNLCSSMRSNIYSYSSSISACERASEKAMEQIAQELFDMSWQDGCAGKGAGQAAGVTARTAPAKEEVSDAATENMALPDDLNGDSSDGDTVWAEAPPLTAKEDTESSLQTSPDSADDAGPDEAWLDKVLDRNNSVDPLAPETPADNASD